MSSTKKINFATQTRAGLLDHKLPVNNVTVFHLGIANQKVDKRPPWTSHGGGGRYFFPQWSGNPQREPITSGYSAWCEEGQQFLRRTTLSGDFLFIFQIRQTVWRRSPSELITVKMSPIVKFIFRWLLTIAVIQLCLVTLKTSALPNVKKRHLSAEEERRHVFDQVWTLTPFY